jgi:phosphoribosyl-dephospho-CoA transferase
MPKYVAGKDYKSNDERLFEWSNSDYYNKKQVVKKVIKLVHGEKRRHQLTKALNKMSSDDVVMLGMVVARAIKKENEVRKQTDE